MNIVLKNYSFAGGFFSLDKKIHIDDNILLLWRSKRSLVLTSSSLKSFDKDQFESTWQRSSVVPITIFKMWKESTATRRRWWGVAIMCTAVNMNTGFEGGGGDHRRGGPEQLFTSFKNFERRRSFPSSSIDDDPIPRVFRKVDLI